MNITCTKLCKKIIIAKDAPQCLVTIHARKYTSINA
jgi:hypothetical protein